MGYTFEDYLCLGRNYEEPGALVFNYESEGSWLTDEELTKYQITFSRVEELIERSISRPYFPDYYYHQGKDILERLRQRQPQEEWFFIEALIGPTPFPTKYIPVVEKEDI